MLRLVRTDEHADEPLVTTPRRTPAATVAAVDLLARIKAELERTRAENDQLRANLDNAETHPAQASAVGYMAGLGADLQAVPFTVLDAFRDGHTGDTVTVPVDEHDVTIVLAQDGTDPGFPDPVAELTAWNCVLQVLEEARSLPTGATGMWRGELPAQIGALVWHRDGEPVIAVSLATTRRALREALQAAGHQVVGNAS